MGNICFELCSKCFESGAPSEGPQFPDSSESAVDKSGPSEAVGRTNVSEPQIHDSSSIEASSNQVQERIRDALANHLLLKHLNYIETQDFISKLKSFSFGPNKTIVKQGDEGDFFYILDSGSVEVQVDQSPIAVLKKDQSFGDMALINGDPRNATVVSLEPCKLWGIDRQNFRATLAQVNKEMFESNRQMLENTNLFKELSKEQIEQLASIAKLIAFPARTTIIKEGHQGDHFYIIKNGRVSCSVKGKKIKEMYEGECFGELALFHRCKRKATVISPEPVTLLSLERSDIDCVLGSSLNQVILENCIRFSIEQSKYLEFLNKDQMNKMVGIASIKKYSKGQVVIPTGSNKSEAIYSILRGSLIYKGRVFRSLKCIGDTHVLKLSNSIHKSPFTANEDSTVAVYYREDLERTLKYQLKDLRSMNWLIHILEKIPIFRFLSKSKIEEIANKIDVCDFPPGKRIFKENDPPDAFYIVKKGSVSITKHKKELRVIERNNYFGERSILLDGLRSASAVAKESTICWMLAKEEFLRAIDEPTKIQMLRRITLLDDTITLDDLRPISELGHGAFGNVILAVHSKTHLMYAVKYMSLKKLREKEFIENVKNEKEILLKLDHPLIMKMVKKLKDKDRIYIVSEYVRGSDLFDALQKVFKLDYSGCKFYTASLVMILNHLHSQRIIYRDLKPENVMVDDEGYLKLVDFGTAKVTKGRTYTILGTPYYMAPEVILGKGYTFNADLWSLGIMVYQFLFTKPPFEGKKMDIQDLFKCIIENEVEFPSTANVDGATKDFITQLLQKNPAKRMSAKKSKKHSWLSGVIWKDIVLRKIRPPYLPNNKRMSMDLDLALRKQETIVEFIKRNQY